MSTKRGNKVRKVLCKKLPHSFYRYAVTFRLDIQRAADVSPRRRGRITNQIPGVVSYETVLETLKVSATKRYRINTLNGQFVRHITKIYLEDMTDVFLLKLIYSDSIHKIYEYEVKPLHHPTHQVLHTPQTK
jgi:hypothetical protein